ncbi:hypothetical protein [Entomomonas asaccharolytica]|uniref:Uncharacterized protein n=1 Tax=Entomomonas asaccharolytica TaxID=2785331 RepID=A0A974NDX2_9GAMM|nr:hypothetical protein [Entomomonas asaccharolytica]QQP84672.1 hypothetical protein JHT90_09650 [Entomomonas asaccharolytica]
MVTKLLSLLGALAIILLASYANANCAILTDKQIKAVKEPLVELLQIEDTNAQYGYVPKKAIKNIEDLKTALVNLVDARLACEKGLTVNVAAIQADLLKALQLSELDEVEAIYGYDLQIMVEQPPATVGLLIVQVSFGIPCGNDNVLLGYRFRDKAWHRDLLWKSNPYQMITGAYGDYYDYLVLPIKANEPPKIVVIHGSPWCTATWEPLVFDVIKFADKQTQQATLWHRQLITYKGHSLINLTKRANGFELQADVAMIDSELLTRKGIYRYQVDGNKVTREQPTATNPRDFVDDWLLLNQDMAKRFTDKANAEQLAKLQRRLKERNGFYGAIKHCATDDLYQVEVTFNGTKEDDKEETHYFYVKPLQKGYLMHSSATKADSGCTGSDNMAK